ncbi:MAG: type IV secretion system DNA-binding domain-containing protein [Steroidobacteraceae bacterium]
MSAALLYDLTHGGPGLALSYASVQAPMWAALARGRAAARRWLASPAWAVAVTSALGAAMAASGPLFHALGVADTLLPLAGGASLGVLGGYGAGRILASLPDTRPEVQVRGAVVLDAQQDRGLQQNARLAPEAHPAHTRSAPLTLAGVEVPYADETKHFKLIGTTGAGKSTAIAELLAGALARGDRAVIADPDGGFARRFLDQRRGDVILGPFEQGARRWDLFGEIDAAYDIDQLALALIPDHPGSDRSWRGYARTLFTAVAGQARDAGVTDVGQLYDLLVVSDREELKLLVGGTPAQPFFDEHNARMLDSIRSVTSSAVAALQYVARQRAEPLSVRHWIRDGRGVLFIPYRAGQIAALRASISAWMRLAIFETMSDPDSARPLWFVADELDALGPIDGLKDALARLRKFGGRCVLGLQSIAQVSSTYGAGEAQTIVENCANTLILRCSASEHGGTSRFASRLIGDREMIRLSRARSRRPGELLYSISESEHRQVEPAVMDSQIERLADLTGFLKLASIPDWRRVRLQPMAYPAPAPSALRAAAMSLEDGLTHG